MPVKAGTRLVEVVRALDAAGIDALDVHRREATLDDVFLTLTADPDNRGGRRMTAILTASAEPVRATRLRWLVADSLVLARRNLEHVRQIPEKLLDVTLQPLMFVLLFAYVFGGVIARARRQLSRVPDRRHPRADIAFGVIGPATGDRDGYNEGIVDRFRDAADVALRRTCSAT